MHRLQGLHFFGITSFEGGETIIRTRVSWASGCGFGEGCLSVGDLGLGGGERFGDIALGRFHLRLQLLDPFIVGFSFESGATGFERMQGGVSVGAIGFGLSGGDLEG